MAKIVFEDTIFIFYFLFLYIYPQMLVLKNSKFLIKDNSYLYILLDCWMSNQHSLQSPIM